MKQLLTALLLLFIAFITYSQTAPISVVKKGAGTPVILLPGFGCPGEVWNEAAASLTGYQVHQVSYAGFNQLPAIDTPWYSSLRTALINYIKKEDLKTVYLIGHSMGGNLATELAAFFPDRVNKLVIVDALPCMRELMMPGMSAAQITYKNPYNDQLLNMDPPSFFKYVKTMADNMTLNAQKSDTIQQWMQRADRKTFVYGYTDLLKMDLRDQLEKINIPVLILGASFPDRKMTEATFQKQYAKLNDKTILIAGNSKHFIMFDDLAWMNTSISQYFSK